MCFKLYSTLKSRMSLGKSRMSLGLPTVTKMSLIIAMSTLVSSNQS